MSKRIWNLKFVAGNPQKFSQIRSASDNPMNRAKALDGFQTLSTNGWRVWVEHAHTGKRIAESVLEKNWEASVKNVVNLQGKNTNDK